MQKFSRRRALSAAHSPSRTGGSREILPQSPDMPGSVILAGAHVIPGLIDVHNHGNSGADFSDGDPDGIRTMARYLAKERRHVVRARVDDAAV